MLLTINHYRYYVWLKCTKFKFDWGYTVLPRPLAKAGGEGLATGCYDDVIDEFARKNGD